MARCLVQRLLLPGPYPLEGRAFGGMGIAAHRRGDAVIRRSFEAEFLKKTKAEQRRAAVALTVEADEWRREAWAWFVDAQHGDVRGFAATAVRTVAHRQGRVFSARLARVIAAQAAWVDTDASAPMASLAASQEFGRAVFRLIRWSAGCWRVPVLDRAPRSCRA